MSYRAIYLGHDKWIVRKFEDGKCWQKEIIVHVKDPQLYASDQAVIGTAIADKNEWRKV